MASTRELEGRIALVTGGGRGIGRRIAEELAAAGARVAVSARSRDQVEAVAAALGGLAVEADVSREDDVARMVDTVESELGPIDLLVANAGISGAGEWNADPADWWETFEVNVLGVFLCCRAVLPGMIGRGPGSGRVVITGSGASYLPGSTSTAYSASKAAVGRFGETLAAQLAGHGIPVFVISPELVRTDMTEGVFSDDAPWTPPELAPRLVRVLASGRADALSGRYIHAEHDDVEDLIRRAEEIVAEDRNSIRLRRREAPRVDQ
ncbi:MAG: SDR family NAD(P)-dependent oxidoreductase [Gaiellaceae bacterium]